jgi:hypothetical protein
MRFRVKFQGHQLAAAVVWLGVSCAWIHKPNADPAIRGAYLVSGVLWLLIGISCLANYFFTWLEIDAVGLIQRRLWSVRVVPWNEITRVGPWQPGKIPANSRRQRSSPRYSANWLSVDYARAAPMSDRGELVFQPAERDALVSALRAHASEADFDLFPVKP